MNWIDRKIKLIKFFCFYEIVLFFLTFDLLNLVSYNNILNHFMKYSDFKRLLKIVSAKYNDIPNKRFEITFIFIIFCLVRFYISL